ncbi:AbrB family transcriptional regulator [Geminicoccus flavidas]|uniref:AbrB family transcriptional regulator n=1 Tax=Geminicoccus flavidas TaxID=2506407 RepID=UPI00135B8BB6|nr:AbrB family transcriptional regulator [Geminicoccus flavidas]
MIELKLRRFARRVSLPEEAIARLHAQEGAVLYLAEVQGDGYRVMPHDPGFVGKMTKTQDIISRYRNTLQALAR